MRLSAHYAAVLILTFGVILPACNSDEQQKPQSAVSEKPASAPVPDDGVRRVTVQETVDAVAKGEAIIVDVRSAGAFAQSHIKGAVLIPTNELYEHLDELPHDKLIVTYCA
jgi:3-mercaptopyruvate sulfurtransferase SseA